MKLFVFDWMLLIFKFLFLFKKVNEKVKKLIDEIVFYYEFEEIEIFKKLLNIIKLLKIKIIEKGKSIEK